MLNGFADRLARLVPMSEADLDAARALPFTTHQIKRHQQLLQRGDRPDFLYIVLKGWLNRYDIRPDDSSRTTGFMVPGDFCGIHAISRQPMDHSLAALTNAVVGRVELEHLEPIVASNPIIGQALWVSKLADEALLRTWMLNSFDAAHMIAHVICELHMRTHPDPNAKSASLAFPLTQIQLGEALDLTPVHVNRMYRRLREEGLLVFEAARIEIPDVTALRRRASFDPTYLFPASPSLAG